MKKCAQREQRLDRRDAAATDNDAPGAPRSVRLSHRQLGDVGRGGRFGSAAFAGCEVRAVMVGRLHPRDGLASSGAFQSGHS
jgi:hypothetical protein